MRRGVGIVAAAAGLLASAGPAGADVTTAGCAEHQAFVAGDEAAVAARLPARYTPVRDTTSGRPLLFVRAIRCDRMELDGRAVPATMTSYGVLVESPDGRGCASGAPVLGAVKGDVPPACNWYVLSWVANDRPVVGWLRGFPAGYSRALDFDLGAGTFHFAAPTYTMDEVFRERPGEIPVRGTYWAARVKVAFSTDDITSGDATGTVRARMGSKLAALMGASERPYVEGYSLFSAERWAHGSYRKEAIVR